MPINVTKLFASTEYQLTDWRKTKLCVGGSELLLNGTVWLNREVKPPMRKKMSEEK